MQRTWVVYFLYFIPQVVYVLEKHSHHTITKLFVLNQYFVIVDQCALLLSYGYWMNFDPLEKGIWAGAWVGWGRFDEGGTGYNQKNEPMIFLPSRVYLRLNLIKVRVSFSTGNPSYGNYDKLGKITFLSLRNKHTFALSVVLCRLLVIFIGKREIANKRQRTTERAKVCLFLSC